MKIVSIREEDSGMITKNRWVLVRAEDHHHYEWDRKNFGDPVVGQEFNPVLYKGYLDEGDQKTWYARP